MKLLVIPVIFLFFCLSKFGSTVDISAYHDFQDVEEHVKKPVIPILKHSFEQHDQGYRYSFETGNGIHAQETGYIKNKGDKDHETLVQQGTVTYHDEHGHPITLNYIADEHGFQPQGAHLPTPPPIPEGLEKTIHSQNHEEEQQLVYEQSDYKSEQGYH